MRFKDRIFLGSFLVLAAAALLAFPARMTAATPQTGDKAGTGLEYRFDKDALGAPVVQASPSGARGISKLSVRLYGGGSYMAAGDINKGADGYIEFFKLYAAMGMYTAEGGYKNFHLGYDVGGDIIYQITPRLGVGVGVGYLRGSSRSTLIVTTVDETLTITAGPTVSAVPHRLGLFYTMPLSGKLDAIAGLGGDYYAGFRFESVTRLEDAAGEWQRVVYKGLSSSNLGFHGSLGIEYKLSPTMGVFLEAVGRYARFGNFDSITVKQESSLGSSSSMVGKLYLMTTTVDGETVSLFQPVPLGTTPPPDTAETTFTEPKFDLSGLSLKAGFRIRF